MTVVVHGTTRQCAKSIIEKGPDSTFIEPGGTGKAEAFSTCVKDGPFPLGTPEEYARCKSALFAGEDGPALLFVDVPEAIIELAVDELLPIGHGVVQFDGRALEELNAAWETLDKWIVPIADRHMLPKQ